MAMHNKFKIAKDYDSISQQKFLWKFLSPLLVHWNKMEEERKKGIKIERMKEREEEKKMEIKNINYTTSIIIVPLSFDIFKKEIVGLF